LRQLHENQPIRAGDSFWSFIEWVDADLRSCIPPEELVEDGPGIHFDPMRLRRKNRPSKRDVKQWLAWNNGMIAALAKSIRDGHKEVFPILADALEEAGCTGVDLLDSCRQGFAETDGVWVVRVLLGKNQATDAEW